MKIQFDPNFKTVEFDRFRKEAGLNYLHSQLDFKYNNSHRRTT